MKRLLGGATRDENYDTRLLVSAMIRDALVDFECAERFVPKLRRMKRIRFGRRISREDSDHFKRARILHHDLERDIYWFRAVDGYAFWSAAFHLSDAEIDAIRRVFLRRAEPLLERFNDAFFAEELAA